MKNGWVTKKLGEVCEIKLGKTPPRDDYSLWDRQKSSGYVWVSISDMTNLTDGQIIDSKEYITNKAIEEAGVPIVKKGTLLLSFKLTIGRTAIAGRDLSTNEAIAALPLKQEFAQLIDLHYLVFYFAAFDWYLFAAKDDKMLGKTLNKKRLATVPVLIPPLAEQKRIVAKIDAAFEKIEKLKANAERNLANAKELFQSALDEAMRPKDGWVGKRLGEHYTITSSKRVFKDQWKNSGVPFYRAREIVRLARDGYVDNELFISEEMFKEYGEKYGLPRVDDIMITGVGTLGVCYVVKEDDRFYFKDGNIIWLKKNSRELDSRFVEYCFLTDAVKKQVHANHGTTVGTYTIEMAKATVVYAPSIEEQVSIANNCNLFRESFVRLQQNYTRQIADCVEMRQAVLREAFEGRL